MSKTTPEQVKAAGKRLIDSASKRMTQYLADLSVERQAITADNLSREVLIELLAVARVNLRNAKADKESATEQHHRNSEAHWEHADKLAVKREITAVKKKQAQKRHAKHNAAWVKVYQWLEANKDDVTQMKNQDAALSVPDNLVGIYKAEKKPLTLDSVSRAIGKWKNGKWDKPTN